MENGRFRPASQNVGIRHHSLCSLYNKEGRRSTRPTPIRLQSQLGFSMERSAAHIYVSFAMQTSSPIHLAKMGWRPPLIYEWKIQVIGSSLLKLATDS